MSSAKSHSDMPTSTTVDAYTAALPDQPRHMLDKIRGLIATRVPGVRESIRYQMPVFTIDGIYLVYLGAWKHHIGLYPIPALAQILKQTSRHTGPRPTPSASSTNSPFPTNSSNGSSTR
jgi:uncharacterized protein YdhG (YjbR/CyaY superfamily)